MKQSFECEVFVIFNQISYNKPESHKPGGAGRSVVIGGIGAMHVDFSDVPNFDVSRSQDP